MRLAALLLLCACHAYNADYACVPTVESPHGGVTVSNCAWLDDADAGSCG